jgi:hypothetical protein
VVVETVQPKRNGEGGKISVLKSYLRVSDPKAVTIHRWRKRFCDGRGKIDPEKLKIALIEAQQSIRSTESQSMGSVARLPE